MRAILADPIDTGFMSQGTENGFLDDTPRSERVTRIDKDDLLYKTIADADTSEILTATVTRQRATLSRNG